MQLPPSDPPVDHTDRLPEALLLVILNRVADVKDLGRCCAVSRRFRSLARQVDHVLVRVDCVLSDPSSGPPSPDSTKPRSGILQHLARLLARPFQTLLGQVPVAPPCAHSDASHHSPADVLLHFRHLRLLRILLPSAELALPNGSLLRWNARFGSSLHSCVILGASDVSSSSNAVSADEASSDGSMPESFYTNGGLKMRVVWTISSLIAASARHFLLQPIITGHDTLEGLELSDADGQGVLRMGREQLAESRERPACVSSSSQRTLVPALDMRLWYAARLEVGPGGGVLEGATLIAIRPSRAEGSGDPDGGVDGFDAGWIAGEFEEPYADAARMLMKRRMYCLEMNSF